MRKYIYTAVLACSMLFSYSQKKSSISYNTSSNGNQHSVTINDDELSLSLVYTGDIAFNDAEDAIASLAPDGYLRYKKNGKKLVVNADSRGEITYEFNDGDKKTELNAEEKAFLADAIKVMIEYGVGAKERVARIYKKGGSGAVLVEVKNMKTDYVRGIYLDFLLETNTLTTTDMTTIADNIHFLMQSDYEKGELLGKFSSKYLSNPTTAQAYLGAVKSINSDFEKGKAVKAILRQELTSEQFSAVLDVANSIGSDYEKAGVLKEVLAGSRVTPTQFPDLLRAVARIQSDFEKSGVLKQILQDNRIPEDQFKATMAIVASLGSDYEKAGVLKEVLSNNKIPASEFVDMLNATTHIQGDYEKAGVLKQILKDSSIPDEEFNETLAAVGSIGSDFEKAGVLKQLAQADIKGDAHWISLIGASEKVGADYEKGEVLRDIASRMPGSENIRSPYLKAAKTISSDYEYGRTIRAVK